MSCPNISRYMSFKRDMAFRSMSAPLASTLHSRRLCCMYSCSLPLWFLRPRMRSYNDFSNLSDLAMLDDKNAEQTLFEVLEWSVATKNIKTQVVGVSLLLYWGEPTACTDGTASLDPPPGSSKLFSSAHSQHSDQTGRL